MNAVAANATNLKNLTNDLTDNGVVYRQLDVYGRTLFMVKGDEYIAGTTRHAAVMVFAMDRKEAGIAARAIHKEKTGRELYVNNVTYYL